MATDQDRHVSFNNETEIRYRTASEASSASTLTNKKIKTNSKPNKNFESGFNNSQNTRSYAYASSSKHIKKAETENKFDMLLNGNCSWSYKSLISSYKTDNDDGKPSFMHIQSSEASISFSENVEKTGSPEILPTTGSEITKNRIECLSINLGDGNTLKVKQKYDDLNYDYNEIDLVASKKKTRKKTLKRKGKIYPNSKPFQATSGSLRNRKLVNYVGLDVESDTQSNDEIPQTKSDTDRKTRVDNCNGLNIELSDNDTNYSDEGLVLQTRFSDKNANATDIANSIESYSNDAIEILEESQHFAREPHVTTTPLFLKFENETTNANKRGVNLLSDSHKCSNINEDTKMLGKKSLNKLEMINNCFGNEISLDSNSTLENNEISNETYNCRNKLPDTKDINVELYNSDLNVDLEEDISKRCHILKDEIHSVCNELERATLQTENNFINDIFCENLIANNYKTNNKYLVDQEQDVKSITTFCEKIPTAKNTSTKFDSFQKYKTKNTNSITTSEKGKNETHAGSKSISKTLGKKTAAQFKEVGKESFTGKKFNEGQRARVKNSNVSTPVKSHPVKADVKSYKNRFPTTTEYKMCDEFLQTSLFDDNIEYCKLNEKQGIAHFNSAEKYESNEESDKLGTLLKSSLSNLSFDEKSDSQKESLSETDSKISNERKQKIMRFSHKIPHHNNDNVLKNKADLAEQISFDSCNHLEDATTHNILNLGVQNNMNRTTNPLQIQILERNEQIIIDDLFDAQPKKNENLEWIENIPFDKQYSFTKIGHSLTKQREKDKQGIEIKTARKSRERGFINKTGDTEINLITTKERQMSSNILSIKNAKKNKSAKNPKTWEELEKKLLCDTDSNLCSLPSFNQDEKSFALLEMHCNTVKTDKREKQNKREFENICEYFNNDSELKKSKRNEMKVSEKVLIHNDSHIYPELNQNSGVNDSPNLNIINKVITAMERCTLQYLSACKGNSQDSLIKYDKNDATTSKYSFAVQEHKSTVIHNSGKLNVAEESNNYFDNVDMANTGAASKEEHIEKHKIKENKPFNDILNLNHTVTSKNYDNEKKLKFITSAKNSTNVKKRKTEIEKDADKQQNILESFNHIKCDISKEKECTRKSTSIIMKNFHLEVDASTFESSIHSSVEENSSHMNFNSMKDVDKHYNLRKRKHNFISETAHNTNIRKKKLKGESKSSIEQTNNYNSKTGTCEKKENSSAKLMKDSNSLSQNNNLLSSGLCETKTSKLATTNDLPEKIYEGRTEAIHMSNFEMIEKTNNRNLFVSSSPKTNVKQNRKRNEKSPLHVSSLEKNYRKHQEIKNDNTSDKNKDHNYLKYLNYKTVPEPYRKLNDSQTKINKTGQGENSKNNYIKYLKNLFQSNLPSEENIIEEDTKINSNCKISINMNKEPKKKFIMKSDDDLFSISSDSEVDETGYHSRASQSQRSNLFYDILEEVESKI